jgi:hypothetical protein
MAALKKFHWDAKSSTYGSLLIRIGEGDCLGGEHTSMGHGKFSFSLQKHQAAV